MPARLTALFNDRPAPVWTMDEDRPYQLGRDPACDCVIDDDRVSRRHGEFAAVGGTWHLRDLGSKNGVMVGGRRVLEAELREESWVSLGGLPLRFEPLTADQARRDTADAERRRRITIELTRAPASPASSIPALLESARVAAQAERAFLFSVDPEGKPRLTAASPHGVAASLTAGGSLGSAGALEQALASTAPVVVADVTKVVGLAERASVRGQGIMALVCLPLRVADRVVGLFYADRQSPQAFTELDVELLAALSDHLGLALAGARLASELTELAQLTETQ